MKTETVVNGLVILCSVLIGSGLGYLATASKPGHDLIPDSINYIISEELRVGRIPGFGIQLDLIPASTNCQLKIGAKDWRLLDKNELVNVKDITQISLRPDPKQVFGCAVRVFHTSLSENSKGGG